MCSPGFTFLVPAHPGNPEQIQEGHKTVCVCVCVGHHVSLRSHHRVEQYLSFVTFMLCFVLGDCVVSMEFSEGIDVETKDDFVAEGCLMPT